MSKNGENMTMKQIVDIFRGLSNKTYASKGWGSISLSGCGSGYTKTDAERIMIHLVERKVFVEKTVTNGSGFPTRYIFVV
jgi:hypothetical protein